MADHDKSPQVVRVLPVTRVQVRDTRDDQDMPSEDFRLTVIGPWDNHFRRLASVEESLEFSLSLRTAIQLRNQLDDVIDEHLEDSE